MKIVIELPGIRAISRNQTTGHFINYASRLEEAENWMATFGKHLEHHFEKPVDVLIQAYIDTVNPHKVTGKTGKTRTEYNNLIDTPNIDDKIFTDILIRWKPSRKFGRLERMVWFIEDDNPKYLREVTKKTIASNENKVVITITDNLIYACAVCGNEFASDMAMLTCNHNTERIIL